MLHLNFCFITLEGPKNKKRRNKMKIKKFNKKLSLNKKTIANLSNDEMSDVQGGGTGDSFEFCIVTVPDTTCMDSICPRVGC
jgi:hypothetical protein